VDEQGNQVTDDTFLLLFNGHHEAVPFLLPACLSTERWQVLLDTSNASEPKRVRSLQAGNKYKLKGRSLALLRRDM
jgi:glycogen operon protein